MVEIGQNLTLVAKTTDYKIRVHSAFDKLDGDFLLKLAVGAFGQINCSTPAAHDLFFQCKNPDAFPDHRIAFDDRAAAAAARRAFFERGGDFLFCGGIEKLAVGPDG